MKFTLTTSATVSPQVAVPAQASVIITGNFSGSASLALQEQDDEGTFQTVKSWTAAPTEGFLLRCGASSNFRFSLSSGDGSTSIVAHIRP